MPKYKVLVEDLKVEVSTSFKKDSVIVLTKENADPLVGEGKLEFVSHEE